MTKAQTLKHCQLSGELVHTCMATMSDTTLVTHAQYIVTANALNYFLLTEHNSSQEICK